ncbi:MAG: hypothetical protein EOL87_09715 [Spartobacteria bacterium]|nr:hypothetical protein [Spartobacteria bacterium]
MEFYSIQNKIKELAEQQTADALPKESPHQTDAASFDNILNKMVTDVDSLQQEATHAISGLAETEQQGEEAILSKMKEADNAYNLMMQIRHKLVDVYAEVEKRAPES